MADYWNPKFGGSAQFAFFVTNAVTNATNVDLGFDANNTSVVMPYAGSIVGITAGSSANVTAGTVTFTPHLASTEYTGLSCALSTAASNATYATYRPNALTFAAGQKVGVSYVSTTDAAPTNTNDYTAILWIHINPD